ncbi:MAG: hypothetical protein WC299_00475 [Kiritimatiellia bacterium]
MLCHGRFSGIFQRLLEGVLPKSGWGLNSGVIDPGYRKKPDISTVAGLGEAGYNLGNTPSTNDKDSVAHLNKSEMNAE